MADDVIPLRGPGRPAFNQANRDAADRFTFACRKISISKDIKWPLWRQLAEQLEAVIRDGVLEPHSRIPSEEAMAEMFGVSRPVVRNALQTLASRGLIVKVHRKGIYVGAPPLETDFITTNLSAYDDMIARGHKVSTHTFEFLRALPDAKEQEALQLKPDETVIRIGRVFWMDNHPITHTKMTLHGGKLPGFEALDIEDRSVLGLVRERYGLSLKRAERWFKACFPPKDVSLAMNVSENTPMIWIESIAYEANNTPLEYYRAYYNSDTARVHLSITE
ncbi:MAG: GntR family transcriptional regulator [Stappiaceae bacterium]